MKKLILGLSVVSLAISLEGCSNGYKTEMSKNEPYQESFTKEVLNTTLKQHSEKLESGISNVIFSDEYILPECEIRVYTTEELSALSTEQLRLARNEIYAKHGRIFSSDDLKAYFTSKSWYTPLYSASEFDEKGDSIFNEFEIANRDLIVQMENSNQESSTAKKIDYKGSYKIQGSEYLWVNQYYIKDDILYVEGDYCDGIPNPDAEIEAETIEFYPIKDDIIIKIDENTIMDDDINNINELKNHIDAAIYWFSSTALSIKLDGDYVTNYYGTWQSS